MSRDRTATLRALTALAALLFAARGLAQERPSVDKAVPKPADEPRLSDQAELARAAGLYEAGKYAQCAQEFHALLAPKSPRALHDPSVIEKARVYYAACLIGSGHAKEADEPLERAVRANPQMQPPDSLVFPQAVIDHFLHVQDELRSEIQRAEQERIQKAQAAHQRVEQEQKQRAALVAELKELASEQQIIVKNQRWIAAVPFGVGQFQNRQPVLGTTFLVSEVALGGAAITSILLQSYYRSQQGLKSAESLKQNDHAAGIVLDVSSYGLLAVTAAGILQAELAFVPEFNGGVRRRALPKALESAQNRSPNWSITPSAAPLPGGAEVGVVGRF
jgi:hypothetical protein